MHAKVAQVEDGGHPRVLILGNVRVFVELRKNGTHGQCCLVTKLYKGQSFAYMIGFKCMWYLNEQDHAQERSECPVDLFDQFLLCGCGYEFLVLCYAGMFNVNLFNRADYRRSFLCLFIHSVCVSVCVSVYVSMCVDVLKECYKEEIAMKLASFYTNRNIGGTKTIAHNDSTITLSISWKVSVCHSPDSQEILTATD